ncbi:MAG: fatty acid desaturase, partial [Nitrospira sp.]
MADSSAQSVCWGTVALFSSLTVLTFIGVPLFAYFYDYSLLDWILLGVLYVVTGMGITVGYHRMMTHRSFESRPWVKACLLIMGGWAVQNSALMWCADHIRHHAHTDEDADPYNATKGFWHSHVGWLFLKDPYRDDR